MVHVVDVGSKFPRAYSCLFDPYEYLGLYGGRGSAKSHSVAAALIDEAASEKHLVLCGREIQGSIRDSVKKLLDNKIDEGGYRRFFESTDTEIRGREKGSLFIFKGLRSTPDSVKSTEGVTRTWLEEANSVSANSLELTLPTIARMSDSRLIATWNPDLATDPIDALFRGNDDKTAENAKKSGLPFEPLPGSVVREVHYEDNPFFPEGLRKQMEWDRARDIDKYNNVWRGKYKQRSEARVFKNWVVREFETPGERDVVFYQGADWGFSVDPSVLVRCFIDEVSRTLYVVEEQYAVGCPIDDLPKLFAGREGATAQELKTWSFLMDAAWPGIPNAKRWKITADSARPETIAYMSARGFYIEAAKKGAGSIEDGLEFLQNFNIVVHPRCKHTIDELSFYAYKTDPKTGVILPILSDKKNHVIDALRYAVEGVANSDVRIFAELGRRARLGIIR